jgi:hypothetical protein
MSAALGQQWMDVQFNPSTTMAAARHVTASCSGVAHVRLQSLAPDAAHSGMVQSARYNVSHASDADIVRLQTCLHHFRSVLGITLSEAGGY